MSVFAKLIVMIFVILHPVLVFAELNIEIPDFSEVGLVTTLEEGKFTLLDKDVRAPFEGVLLSPTAMAAMLSQNEFAVKHLALDYQYKLALLEAKYKSESQQLQVSLSSQKALCEERLGIQQKEIDRLQTIAIDAPSSGGWFWWGLGGFATGITTAAVLVLLL
jgi:hypothetical protein